MSGDIKLADCMRISWRLETLHSYSHPQKARAQITSRQPRHVSERESRKSNDDHDDDPDDSDDDDDLVLRSEDRDTDMARNAPVLSFLSECRLNQSNRVHNSFYQTRFTPEDIFFYSSSLII